MLNKIKIQFSSVRYWHWAVIITAGNYLQKEFNLLKFKWSWASIKKFGLNLKPMIRPIKALTLDLCPVQAIPKYVSLLNNITTVCNKLDQTHTYLQQIIAQASHYQQVELTFNCTNDTFPSTYYNFYAPIRANFSEWQALKNATGQPCDINQAVNFVMDSYDVNFKNLGIPLVSTMLIPIAIPACFISMMKSHCNRPFAIERGYIHGLDAEPTKDNKARKQQSTKGVELLAGKDVDGEDDQNDDKPKQLALMETVIKRSSRCACCCWTTLLSFFCYNLLR